MPLADDADADVALVQLPQITADENPQQVEEPLDLLRRSRPVFRGEAEQGQVAQAAPAGEADSPAQGLDAAPVSFPPRQAVRMRPAPVAVHDDPDMAGERNRIGGGFDL